MTCASHVKVGRHTLIADQVGHTRSSKHLSKVLKNSTNKKQKRAPLYFAASSGELWGDDNTCDRISANNSCDDKLHKSCDIGDTPRPQSDTTWPMPSFECTSQHLEIGSGTFVVVPIVNHKNIWLRKKSPSLVGSRFEKHGGASGDRSQRSATCWLQFYPNYPRSAQRLPRGEALLLLNSPACSPTKFIHILFYTSFKVAILRMGSD